MPRATPPASSPPLDPTGHTQTFAVDGAEIVTAAPALAYPGAPTAFAPPRPWGQDEPRWLSCHLADGQRVQALGFVLRRNLPCYAGALPDHVLTQVFADACGHYGTTRDYVEKTVNSLRAHAMPDRKLEAALMRCCKQGSLSLG